MKSGPLGNGARSHNQYKEFQYVFFLLHFQIQFYQFDPLEPPSIAHPDMDIVGPPPRAYNKPAVSKTMMVT